MAIGWPDRHPPWPGHPLHLVINPLQKYLGAEIPRAPRLPALSALCQSPLALQLTQRPPRRRPLCAISLARGLMRVRPRPTFDRITSLQHRDYQVSQCRAGQNRAWQFGEVAVICTNPLGFRLRRPGTREKSQFPAQHDSPLPLMTASSLYLTSEPWPPFSFGRPIFRPSTTRERVSSGHLPHSSSFRASPPEQLGS